MESLSLRKIKQYLPYSYLNIFKSLVDKDGVTVLDVGTGDGYLINYINSKRNYSVTGIEPFKPFLKQARETGAYKKILQGRAQKLRYPKNSFDIVISSQVLEYLTKTEGISFMKKAKDIARNQVIIAAYIGDCKHKRAQENPYQTSHSEWYPEDLEILGFKVYGQGLKLVYKENGYRPKNIGLAFVLPMLLSYLMSPVVYYLPRYATHMIGVINKK